MKKHPLRQQGVRVDQRQLILSITKNLSRDPFCYAPIIAKIGGNHKCQKRSTRNEKMAVTPPQS